MKKCFICETTKGKLRKVVVDTLGNKEYCHVECANDAQL